MFDNKDISENEIEEWLNKESPYGWHSVVYYPDGVIRKFDGSVFDRKNVGDIVNSDYCGLVVIAEKTMDNKRVWLEAVKR